MSESRALPALAASEVSLTRGRPRSDASREAILSATTELLKVSSLRDLTIDSIARRASVGKFTIYRWWPTKAYVALEAVMHSMRRSVTPPDTGSTEQDFSLHLRSVIRFYNGAVGGTIRQLLAEGQNDAEFGNAFRHQFLQPRREVIEKLWQRGVERGDVASDVPMEVALDLISGPMMYRLMAGHAPLNDSQADALIAHAFQGLSSKNRKKGK